MVAAGPLMSLFPFQPRETAVPDDFANDDDVPEASAMPLDDERYSRLVQSSMPPTRSAARIEAAARALGVRESDLVQALQVIEARNSGG
jgi:predicted component of type VI protein secretion system